MAPASRSLVALCCGPLLASCVFLLDYDELQNGAADSGQGGLPAAGGGGNTESGAGGAACGDCDDHDPCTVDTCDEAGSVATCLHEVSPGLKLDGFEQVLESEQHVRISLVAGTDVFYIAALEVNGGVADVSLYQLAKDGAELEPLGDKIASTLPAGVTILSNVGLAVDPTLGGLAVHGFVAVKPAIGSPRVFHVVSRNGKNTSNLVGVSYSSHSPWVFPQALAIGTKVVGAWIQEDGTIAVHQVGAVAPEFYGDATLPATTLALLSSTESEPAVMFTSQTDDVTLSAYVESSSHARADIVECQTAPGGYLSSSVIGTQIPGLWLSNITRAGDDYLTTGGATLVCGANACTAVTDQCEPAKDLANNVRNVAGATVQADAPGIVYSVIALPQVGLKMGSETQVEARLSLGLGRVDFSNEQAQSSTLGGDARGLMEVARQDTDESLMFAGPDWPAVGILPSKQVALAWIQPSQAGTELHIQRYKMCVPEE